MDKENYPYRGQVAGVAQDIDQRGHHRLSGKPKMVFCVIQCAHNAQHIGVAEFLQLHAYSVK